MQYTISKTYSTTISINFQSQKFTTSLTKEIEVNSAEELLTESTKLFQQAKLLTEKDIERYGSKVENVD